MSYINIIINAFNKFIYAFCISILFFFSSFSISSCRSNIPESNIIGQWIGKNDSINYKFNFMQNRVCKIHLTNFLTNSTTTVEGNYIVNSQKKPFAITIEKIAKLQHSLYSIIKFVNNDSLVIADFSSRWRLRPIAFNNSTDIYLKRMSHF